MLDISQFLSGSNYSHFFKSMEEDLFSLKDTKVDSRLYNHWKKEKLVDVPNEGKRRWEKLNFTEFIWIEIINELREFGFPYEKILKVKSFLFKEPTIEDCMKVLLNDNQDFQKYIDEALAKVQIPGLNRDNVLSIFQSGELGHGTMSLGMPYLSLMLYNIIIQKKKVGCIIFNNGDTLPWHDDIPLLNDKVLNLLSETHIFIPFNKYIFRFISDKEKEKFISPLKILTDDELELIRYIRSGEFKEIKLKFDKGKPYVIETTVGQQLTKEQSDELIKILGLGNYQAITLKTNNNKSIYFERTHKHNL